MEQFNNASDSYHNLYNANNPLHTYSVEKIDLNTNKDDIFTHQEAMDLLKYMQNVSQAKFKLRSKCAKYDCQTAISNLESQKKFISKQMRIVNKMGPITMKTNGIFPLNSKSKTRMRKTCESETFDNVNKIMNLSGVNLLKVKKGRKNESIEMLEEDKCLVFPRPTDHTFLSKNACMRIIKNDCGMDIPTGELSSITRVPNKRICRNYKKAVINNDPHHVIKTLKTSILKSGSAVDSLQGRNSMMRRNILARPLANSIRGTILSHPYMISEIILPESYRKCFNMVAKPTLTQEQFFDENFMDYFEDLPFDWSCTVKRDPVLTMGSYVAPDKIAFWNGDCIVIPQLCLELMHGDIDGDENSIGMNVGIDSKIELFMAMNPQCSMYLPFNMTRIVFSQSHALHMFNRLPIMYRDLYRFVKQRILDTSNKDLQLQETIASIRAMCIKNGINPIQNLNPEYTKDVLNTTLLYITLEYGDYEAYKFVKHINDIVCALSNGKQVENITDSYGIERATPRIYMTNNNLLCESIAAIVSAKAKGSYDAYYNMCLKLDSLDGTTEFRTEDNSDKIVYGDASNAMALDNFEKNKYAMSNQMINNSNKISKVAYKTTANYTYLRPVIVGHNYMVYYNQQALIPVHLLINASLIINPGVALHIYETP